MNQKDLSAACDQQLGVCGLDPNDKFTKKRPKPIELYTFIDPLCSECWAFEPLLKKLQVEYGEYFRIRTVVAGRLQSWNKCKDKNEKLAAQKKEITTIWEMISPHPHMPCTENEKGENENASPYLTSIAIKAAELQGPQAGTRFVRQLREFLFLKKKNITRKETILTCAELAELDCEEFKKDLSSGSAAKALHCDMNTTNEMEVDVVPTFVFFNDNIEDEGIKVSGHYPYYVYIEILEEMLGFKPRRAEPISLEQFFAKYGFAATIEVAVVFDLTEEEAERRLKKLVLQQKVEAIPVKHGTFWRYLA